MLLLALFLATCLATQLNGGDWSEPISAQQARDLAASGTNFAIVRGYRSNSQVDQNAARSIQNLNAAGISTGEYMFLNDRSGKSGAQQLREMEAYNKAHGIKPARVWLDIEQPKPGVYWQRDLAQNHKFFNDIVQQAKKDGVPLGVYSDRTMWHSTMGTGFHPDPSIPLWYSRYDRTPKTFKDFQRFGGWNQPTIKQWGDSGKQCGRGVPCTHFDQDWAPGQTAQTVMPPPQSVVQNAPEFQRRDGSSPSASPQRKDQSAAGTGRRRQHSAAPAQEQDDRPSRDAPSRRRNPSAAQQPPPQSQSGSQQRRAPPTSADQSPSLSSFADSVVYGAQNRARDWWNNQAAPAVRRAENGARNWWNNQAAPAIGRAVAGTEDRAASWWQNQAVPAVKRAVDGVEDRARSAWASARNWWQQQPQQQQQQPQQQQQQPSSSYRSREDATRDYWNSRTRREQQQQPGLGFQVPSRAVSLGPLRGYTTARQDRSGGPLYWRGKADIDVDGSGPHYHDPYAQSTTSLTVGRGQALNADKTPFVVVPPRMMQQYGVRPGDYAMVRYKGRETPAIVGDVGPRTKVGEVSHDVAARLHFPNVRNPNMGRVDSGVEYMVYPHSRLDRRLQPSDVTPEALAQRVRQFQQQQQQRRQQPARSSSSASYSRPQQKQQPARNSYARPQQRQQRQQQPVRHDRAPPVMGQRRAHQ